MESPRFEAEILLAHALNLKRTKLHSNPERILTEQEVNRFNELIHRRSKHEPIAYITGVQPFMSLDFFVDRSVLIPRPETEKLVEISIDIIKSSYLRVEGASSPLIADIGTGSGIIAISLAKYLSNVNVIGIDSSPDAIKIARKNAENYKLSDQIEFNVGNLFDTLEEQVDMIISNPPYIPSTEIDNLESDVKDWEPRAALDGGKDGLDHIREIISQAPNHLKPKGHLIIEIGFDQGQKVKEIAVSSHKYSDTKIIKDLNGKDRILKATRLL
jgi:release factor glutamine methyltransferase